MDFHQILPILISPIFLLLFIFYLKFKFDIKSFKGILLALFLGMLSTLSLVFAYYIANSLDLHLVRNLRRTIFFAFVITGFGSEFGKFIVLYFGFFKRKDFFGPIESIIYSLFISIGFTIVASLLYITGFISPINNIMFLYLYGVANLVFAIILGFFIGLGKSRENNLIDSMTGLVAASFFHGVLAFCILTEDYTLLTLIGIASVIISVVLAFKSIDYKQIEKKQIQ